MRAVIEIDVPVVLRGHYRRYLSALARLRMPVGEDQVPSAAGDLAVAVNEVLDELEGAAGILLASLTGTARQECLRHFLACRTRRLAVAADDITAAAKADDLPLLRRHLIQFRALAAAMWKVQLSVCAGDLEGMRADRVVSGPGRGGSRLFR